MMYSMQAAHTHKVHAHTAPANICTMEQGAYPRKYIFRYSLSHYSASKAKHIPIHIIHIVHTNTNTNTNTNTHRTYRDRDKQADERNTEHQCILQYTQRNITICMSCTSRVYVHQYGSHACSMYLSVTHSILACHSLSRSPVCLLSACLLACWRLTLSRNVPSSTDYTSHSVTIIQEKQGLDTASTHTTKYQINNIFHNNSDCHSNHNSNNNNNIYR